MSKTTIILVRHCEAEGNVKRIFQGHWNGKITENGALQLVHLAERMKNHPFDYLYSSPLSRTVSTAKACNKFYNRPIHILESLIEINGGDLEGLFWSDFPENYPDESLKWVGEPHLFEAPGGESMQSVYERMSQSITMLAKRHEGKRVCVVSHGCAIRNFLCYARGLGIEKLNDVSWCDNTAVSEVEYDGDFNAHIVLENDSSHISDDLSTFAKQKWWRKENADLSDFGK